MLGIWGEIGVWGFCGGIEVWRSWGKIGDSGVKWGEMEKWEMEKKEEKW